MRSNDFHHPAPTSSRNMINLSDSFLTDYQHVAGYLKLEYFFFNVNVNNDLIITFLLIYL